MPDRAGFDRSSVSRETLGKLDIIVAQLRKWQRSINLVSPTTMDHLWDRHVRDSLQLAALAPEAGIWIDLGSGGGFPGLVVAAEMVRNPQFRMILVESNGKKCAFLRETSRLAGLPVEVIYGRIEDVVADIAAKHGADVVSARALASLPRLLDYAEPLLKAGAMGIFPKGQDVDGELADASRAWNLDVNLIQSQTEPDASIVVVRSGSRKPLQPEG